MTSELRLSDGSVLLQDYHTAKYRENWLRSSSLRSSLWVENPNIQESIWKEGDLNVCFDKLLNARKEERSVPSAFAVLGLTKL